MFLNPWSIALTLCSLCVLFLAGLSCQTAVRVLRFWDVASDSNRQIGLENETWLVSTLVQYALGFQIVSLILFILAADSFCQVIVGAMCATGALLANPFGMPALFVKLVGLFFYGFWLLLQQLDISSEKYPLVRLKYRYLLILLPLLLADFLLQTLYISGLKPDIITSCCAVVFGEGGGAEAELFGGGGQIGLLPLFYGAILLLLVLGVLLLRRWRVGVAVVWSGGWLAFLFLAMMVITRVISSYIYAMPFHHCPFCILKPEYHYIGFAIYGTLIPAAFFGITGILLQPLGRPYDLAPAIADYQRRSVTIALLLLLLFTAVSSYHYLLYRLLGGES